MMDTRCLNVFGENLIVPRGNVKHAGISISVEVAAGSVRMLRLVIF